MVTYNSVEWHKVVQAFTYMYSASANHKRYKNSRLYALARREVGKIISKHQTGSGNSQFGTTWVTHLRNRHCCKIPLSELQTYKDQGYIEKRVINWDKQDQKQKAKREKILKDISRVNQKIAKLQDTKITLEGKMELLEGVKPS